MARGFSLHIGLSEVSSAVHGDSKPAPGCAETAQAMQQLGVELGYQHSTVLVNDQATRAAVTAEFTSMVAQLEAGDILFLSLAGHGIEHVATGLADEEKDQAFLLFDAKLVDDEVYELLKSIPIAARVIVVIEACYSGSLAEADFVDVTRSAAAGGPGGLMHAHDSERIRTPFTSPAFRRNEAKFRLHASLFPGRPKVTANVLLLAAAADTTLAQGRVGPGLPPFSGTLLRVVQEATSYRDLNARIAEEAASRSFSTPVLNENLVTEVSFIDQRPFSIA